MAVWLTTCVVVLAAILSSLLVVITIAIVTTKLCGPKPFLVLPEAQTGPRHWPCQVPEPPWPSPPGLLISEARLPHLLGPHPSVPVGRARSSLKLSLAAPKLSEAGHRQMETRRLSMPPMPPVIRMRGRTPLASGRPEILPRLPAETQATPQLQTPVHRCSPIGLACTQRPSDSHPQQPIYHPGSTAAATSLVLPRLVQEIPNVITINSPSPPMTFNSTAGSIGRIDIGVSLVWLHVSLQRSSLRETEPSPVLPPPAINPPQPGQMVNHQRLCDVVPQPRVERVIVVHRPEVWVHRDPVIQEAMPPWTPRPSRPPAPRPHLPRPQPQGPDWPCNGRSRLPRPAGCPESLRTPLTSKRRLKLERRPDGQLTSTLGGSWSMQRKASRFKRKNLETSPGPADYSPEHPAIFGRIQGRVPGFPERRRDPDIRL